MMKYIHRLALIMFVIMGISGFQLVKDAFVNPLENLKLTVISASPKEIVYSVEGIRNSRCASSDVERFITSKAKPTLVGYRDRVPVLAYRIGPFHYEDIVVPSIPLPPGEYTLEVRLVNFCGALVRADFYPPASFKIQ